MSWWRLLLLLPVRVIIGTNVNQCEPNQYELGSRCCDLCPPGYFVSGPCDMEHLRQCSPCPPDTFMPYDNRESECRRCSRCRQDDQEMVSDCAPRRDRRCQCKTGTYCDSEDCSENCYRCTSCKGATLQTCNATMDTVCATDRNPEPGNPASGSAESSPGFVKVGVPIIAVVIGLVIGIGIGIRCCRRPGLKALHSLAIFLKKKSSEPGSHSLDSIQFSTLLATDPERGPPAPGEATTPLLQEGDSALAPGVGTRPGPSEERGEDTELQEVVAGGSQAAPEQELQTAAPPAPGLQGQAEAAASLRHLEQQYKQQYFLKDTSCDAKNKICYEFVRKVPANDWKMFMRLVGLGENDINICEHENPGNLMEQCYKMLVRWKNRLGRDASPFTLMAALHKMELHEELHNIINHLVAENILGRHAETPN
ncbi:tumor necrosis factor receptor superfamily member 10B-like isoform X1 [Saccopteryx leptura]|uniref:tumor necrosis factor receptor superfamily member 10B-like isoform X1 n=1 Tax=Saccopteryx leptura TaxID=249018 RepID=UPI00339C78E8